MIVADTNVIAYLHLKARSTPLAKAALRKDSQWVAPMLWRSEFRNVLALYMRRGELSPIEARRVMTVAEDFMQRREYEISSTHVLDLVANSRCSSYDCEFVALAQELALKLITSDRQMLTEFPSITMSLREFAA